MRPAQQKNRSRGRGSRKGSGGGGGGGNVINRVYDSAGPEGKVRGTPQQIIDKYLSLARDAQTTGDRVVAENFLQHAEHYQRLLMQANAAQEQNRREQAESGSDGDDGADAALEGRRQEPQQRGESQPEASGSGEIGGMTMIDSGKSGDDLLVVSDEAAQNQPRRNGDGRRRRRRQSDDSGQEGAPQPGDSEKVEAQSES